MRMAWVALDAIPVAVNGAQRSVELRSTEMSSAPQDWRAPTPFEAERIGAVALYCSDGRYGDQFDEFLHGALGLPRYDRLAIPGGSAPLAGHIEAMREEDSLRDQLRFLIDSHALDRVVLIAHSNCGFYLHRLHVSPANIRARQEADLATAAEAVRAMSSRVEVEAYFADLANGVVTMRSVAT